MIIVLVLVLVLVLEKRVAVSAMRHYPTSRRGAALALICPPMAKFVSTLNPTERAKTGGSSERSSGSESYRRVQGIGASG